MRRQKIEDALLKMGTPISIKGFTYIADAIEYFDEMGTTKMSVTKVLYPEIARRNKTTSNRVERAIRHAFEVIRNLHGDYDLVEHYIGFSNCTNYNSLVMLYTVLKREEEQPDILVENDRPMLMRVTKSVIESLLSMTHDELYQLQNEIESVEQNA